MNCCTLKIVELISLKHPYSQNLYNLLYDLEENEEKAFDFEELKFRI